MSDDEESEDSEEPTDPFADIADPEEVEPRDPLEDIADPEEVEPRDPLEDIADPEEGEPADPLEDIIDSEEGEPVDQQEDVADAEGGEPVDQQEDIADAEEGESAGPVDDSADPDEGESADPEDDIADPEDAEPSDAVEADSPAEKGGPDPFDRLGGDDGRRGDPFARLGEQRRAGEDGPSSGEDDGQTADTGGRDTGMEFGESGESGRGAFPDFGEPDGATAGPEEPLDDFEDVGEDPVQGAGETVGPTDSEDGVWERMDEAASADVEADPEERYVEVSKHSYCEQCEYFSDPPEVACSHEGTEILEFTDMETVRLRDCPIVEQRRALEDEA